MTPSTFNDIKLIGLRVENIKRLTAIDINLDGDLIQITGNNGQGKTSLLDCIWWALAGASTHQSKPIHNGADQGTIRLDLGQIIVYREFSIKKDGDVTTKLTLTWPDGQKIPGGSQTLLDTFYNKFTFDPQEFANMDSKAQFNALRQFVPDVNFELIEAENKKDYEERTDLNRKAKDNRSSAQSIITTASITDKSIDDSKLIDQMQKAGEHNTTIKLRQQKRKQVADDIVRLREEARVALKDAAELQQKLDDAEDLPDLIDVTELNKEIQDAKVINELIKLREDKTKYELMAKKYEDESEVLTKRMAKRQDDKLKAISKAKLPVKELSFGDGIILYNGIPFDQASDAERLKVSMSIAMASNPKLRLLRVRQGSLLDEKSKKIVLDMAKENKFQVIMETVGTNSNIGIIIEMEDGKVKSTVSETKVSKEDVKKQEEDF